MKRKIEQPFYTNTERNQISCIFEFADGSRAQAMVNKMNGDDVNPDWSEIIETFGVDDIEQRTKEVIELDIARQKEGLAGEKRQFEEHLFNLKLEVFEIPEIKASKNTKLKSKIRRAKKPLEVELWAGVLLKTEWDSSIAEEPKPAPVKKPPTKKRAPRKKAAPKNEA
jgi:hypothetical protein